MSRHTGASGLLVLISAPGAVVTEASARPFLPPATSPAICVVRARRSLRNAVRRLLRAHGGRAHLAAAALGISTPSFRAMAGALGMALPSVTGRPRKEAEDGKQRARDWLTNLQSPLKEVYQHVKGRDPKGRPRKAQPSARLRALIAQAVDLGYEVELRASEILVTDLTRPGMKRSADIPLAMIEDEPARVLERYLPNGPRKVAL